MGWRVGKVQRGQLESTDLNLQSMIKSTDSLQISLQKWNRVIILQKIGANILEQTLFFQSKVGNERSWTAPADKQA